MKPTRKDTHVPQPCVSTDNVVDEDVHKELGNSLVRAATIASSLEAEQVSETNSGGVLGCQEAMGYTIAQTRFKRVSKQSNDSLLARVSLTRRVESSDDEDSLGEDASKQGRINAIDKDEDITLVSFHKVHDEINIIENVVEVINTTKLIVDAALVSAAETTISAATATKIIDDATLAPKKKGLVIQELAEQEQEANIALINTWDDIQAKIDDDHQLAKRMQAQEQEDLSDAEKATLFQQLLEKIRKHFAAKRVKEKRNKPPIQAQQRKIMCTYLKNIEGYKLNELKLFGFDAIQKMFDRAFKRVNTCVDFRTELEEDEEEVAIDAIPLAVKPIIGWKIYKEGKKSYYQIMRADEKSQMYMFFSQVLKSFDREDLEDLYKLVKAKYGSTKPVAGLDLLLWGDLKAIFQPHAEDEVWKAQRGYKVLSWKLYDSYGVHSLRMQSIQIYMLVEKKYPLKPPTLTMMLEKKLQLDYESEMAYQLIRSIKVGSTVTIVVRGRGCGPWFVVHGHGPWSWSMVVVSGRGRGRGPWSVVHGRWSVVRVRGRGHGARGHGCSHGRGPSLGLFGEGVVISCFCVHFSPIAYSLSHGGTMTMSLMHQWHDTICGGVISPRRSLLERMDAS
ncbi:hypothetical protein Tco_1484811 [Tanacetum coccineum]